MCDAWICESDVSKWHRRLLAAAKRKLEPGFIGQDDYVDKIQKQLDAQGAQNDKTPSNSTNSTDSLATNIESHANHGANNYLRNATAHSKG